MFLATTFPDGETYTAVPGYNFPAQSPGNRYESALDSEEQTDVAVVAAHFVHQSRLDGERGASTALLLNMLLIPHATLNRTTSLHFAEERRGCVDSDAVLGHRAWDRVEPWVR